jgi:FkbM family methyltransferase
MTEAQVEKAKEFLRLNPGIKSELARILVEFDSHHRMENPSIRDIVTGPLLDLIYTEDDVLSKELSDGTKFEFLYRSKIAQEFAMSSPPRPNHVWEPQTTKLLLHLARGAKTVVVGGAYFGDHVIPIAKLISESGGVVHAFEPNDRQREMLIRNAKLNELTNVVPNACGLWNEHNSVLAMVGFDAFASSMDVQPGGEGVSTVRIDEYLKAAGGAIPQLIMIDLEGAEFRALQGAGNILELNGDGAPSLVFEIHSHYVDWSRGLENTEIVAWLESLGYKVYAVRDFNANLDMTGQPVEIIPCRTVYLEGPPHGFNMLAIKNTELIDSSFFRVVPNVSPKLLLGRDPLLHLPVGGMNRL